MAHRLILFVGLVTTLLVARAHAQVDEAPPAVPVPAVATEPPSADAIRAEIETIKGSASIDEATKTAIVAVYEQALEQLRQAETAQAEALKFQGWADGAPGELTRIRGELAAPSLTPDATPPPDATLADVERLLGQAEAEAELARQEVAKLQAEAERRTQRRSTLSEELEAAKKNLATLEQRERALETPTDELTRAQAALLRAQVRAARQRVAQLNQEDRSYVARTDLLPARRDRAARSVADAEAAVKAWQATVRDVARLEAARDAELAQDLTASARRFSGLTSLADANEALVKERQSVQEKLERTSTRLRQTRMDAADVASRARAARRRLEAAGLTDAMGLLLRKEYARLRDPSATERQLSRIRDDMAEGQYQLVVLDEDRIEAGDIDARLSQLIATLPPLDDELKTTRRAVLAKRLLEARRDLLDALIAQRTRHVDRLVELDVAVQSLDETDRSYRRFIEERILWVPSVQAPTRLSIGDVTAAAMWLIAGKGPEPESGQRQWIWPDVVASSVRALSTTLPRLAILAVLILGLLIGRRPMKRELGRLAAEVANPETDTIGHTFRALIGAVLLSIPLPLLLVLAASFLDRPADQVPLGMAVATGLRAAASALLPLLFLREVLHRSGLGGKHFGWATEPQTHIRRHLRWLVPIFVASVFVWTSMNAQDEDAWIGSLGRVAFMIGVSAMAAFAYITLRTSSPLNRSIQRDRASLIRRARPLWYPLAVGLPIVLVGLTMAGYYYSAEQLEGRVRESVWLAFGLLVVHAILIRWLTITRRRLQAEARTKQLRAAESADPNARPPAAESGPIDVVAIDAQTRRFFRSLTLAILLVGFALIWSDVLPAFRMLDRVQLYPSVTILDDTAPLDPMAAPLPATPEPDAPPPTGSNGDAASPIPGSGMPSLTPPASTPTSGEATAATTSSLSLADVLTALVMLVLTIVVVRSVPAVLEIALISRLPIDAGGRYAILTITKYLLMLLGVILVFSALGLAWGKVQWLAAALTFGLAFGLQEIFANFISGLIVLAEQPIRVGDAVTVQGVSGRVARIRMRATTITDWDRKELVIPNKTFITEQVINWTLTDPIMRTTISVGVAYGSDVAKVESTLWRVGVSAAHVLTDPSPMVYFKAFGESSLDFELRVFINHIDHLVPVRHALHRAIDAEFRKAGIEIAFPQRDLHIRSGVPLDIVTTDGVTRQLSDQSAAPAPAPRA